VDWIQEESDVGRFEGMIGSALARWRAGVGMGSTSVRLLRRRGVTSGAEVPWEKAEDGVDPLVLLDPLLLLVTG